MGSKFIGKVKNDPSIRLAVRELKNEIPDLFESIENNQPYFARDKNKDIIRLRYKNSRLEVIHHQQEDGSLIFDSRKGIKNIKQMLKKDGLCDDEIEKRISLLKKSDDNKIIELSAKVIVRKFPTGPSFPSLEAPLIDERIIVLIAYEFLSLLLGNLIYNSTLDFIREFIREGIKSDKLLIEDLTTRSYGTFHKIYPEVLETELIINIILFRWFLYRIHIKGFKLSSGDFVYVEDLKNRKTLIAESLEEARQGIYYDFD